MRSTRLNFEIFACYNFVFEKQWKEQEEIISLNIILLLRKIVCLFCLFVLSC
jgi:hypothetical protein